MASERMSGRTSVRGLQTQEQVLSAARKLFAESGYHQTSLYDLFESAEITKGAFFHHWKTKEDLALSILENLDADFESQFFTIAKGKGKAREKIEALLRRIADLSMDAEWSYGRIFAHWCIELHTDEEKIGPALHALKSRWFLLWRELIHRAQQEHDMRADISAENLSFLVVSAICGVQLLRRSSVPASGKVAFETLRKSLLT